MIRSWDRVTRSQDRVSRLTDRITPDISAGQSLAEAARSSYMETTATTATSRGLCASRTTGSRRRFAPRSNGSSSSRRGPPSSADARRHRTNPGVPSMSPGDMPVRRTRVVTTRRRSRSGRCTWKGQMVSHGGCRLVHGEDGAALRALRMNEAALLQLVERALAPCSVFRYWNIARVREPSNIPPGGMTCPASSQVRGMRPADSFCKTRTTADVVTGRTPGFPRRRLASCRSATCIGILGCRSATGARPPDSCRHHPPSEPLRFAVAGPPVDEQGG